MLTPITFTVSHPMEMLYSLFAIGTQKQYADMIRGFGLEPRAEFIDILQRLREPLSPYLQQEINYFFDHSGLGYILYKYILRNSEVSDMLSFIELLRDETADGFILNILRSVSMNTLSKPGMNKENQQLSLSGNLKEQLSLVEATKFQDEVRKGRVLEAIHHPEEFKIRLLLLLTQYYKQSFMNIEDDVFPILYQERDTHEQRYREQPDHFTVNYLGLPHSRLESPTIIVHISYFKYVSCHSYSSYSPSDADWFVLGIYTKLILDDRVGSERMAAFFKVLSDVNRIEILRLLSERAWFGQELAEKLNITPPTVSYHMSFLQQIGLVSFNRTDNRYYYTLNRTSLQKPLQEFLTWFTDTDSV